jgi:hypothetical protein
LALPQLPPLPLAHGALARLLLKPSYRIG